MISLITSSTTDPWFTRIRHILSSSGYYPFKMDVRWLSWNNQIHTLSFGLDKNRYMYVKGNLQYLLMSHNLLGNNSWWPVARTVFLSDSPPISPSFPCSYRKCSPLSHPYHLLFVLASAFNEPQLTKNGNR